MGDYVYTVWFRDSSLPPDSQDFEFPACILIEAPSERAAIEWGDHLANSLCTRRPYMSVLSSQAERHSPNAPGLSTLPGVEHGHHASDDEIGW
jgi:hypothetical protein